MQGEDAAPIEGGSDSDFQLGAILARLGDPEPDVHGPAVETIRATVEEDPGRCLPTVPKLRSLLGDSEPAVHERVATCLEAMAAGYPDDVAPSVPAIVDFLAQQPPRATAEALVDCLESVAEERPDHVAGALEDLDPHRAVTGDARGTQTDKPADPDELPEPTAATTIEVGDRLLEVRYGD